MNFAAVLLASQVILLCLASGVGRPAGRDPASDPGDEPVATGRGGSGRTHGQGGSSSRQNDASSSPSSSRRTRSGRRLRLLRKVLNKLSPNDVLALIRTKKSGGKSYNPYAAYTYGTQHGSTIKDEECPRALDGVQMFACPRRDRRGKQRCIDDHDLCDNKFDCPGGEDEDGTVCMFHKVTMNNFRILLESIFGLTRSVV